MTWRDILVHIKPYEAWSPHIDLAIALARDRGARLNALYTLRELAMIKLLVGVKSSAAHDAEARDAPLMEASKKRFMDAAAEAGVEGHWLSGEGNASELLTLAGRFHDLVVVSQTRHGIDEVGWDVAEECAVTSGTPTLIVPHRGVPATFGRRIVVAWNDSRQAAAAVHAAVPAIAAANAVTVAIGRGKDRYSSVTRFPDLDIGAYLRQHCKQVDVRKVESSDADVGQRLLDIVADSGADLLVMGAYGRSAWRELVLGGATRHILKNMTVPVLTAH